MQWPNSAEISLYSIEEIVFVGTEAMRDKDYVSKSISIWEFEHLSIYINAYYVQTSGHFQSGVETARSGENKLLTKKKREHGIENGCHLNVCCWFSVFGRNCVNVCVHVCMYASIVYTTVCLVIQLNNIHILARSSFVLLCFVMCLYSFCPPPHKITS